MTLAHFDGNTAKHHCLKIVKWNVEIIIDNFVILRYVLLNLNGL